MESVKKATQPIEVICLLSFELETIKEGHVYMFIILDAYSEFMFQAGIELGDDMEYVLKQIQQFLNSKDFDKPSGQPFTLVLEEFEEYRNEIERLIAPQGGTMVVDAAYINRELGAAIARFMAGVANSNG